MHKISTRGHMRAQNTNGGIGKAFKVQDAFCTFRDICTLKKCNHLNVTIV